MENVQYHYSVIIRGDKTSCFQTSFLFPNVFILWTHFCTPYKSIGKVWIKSIKEPYIHHVKASYKYFQVFWEYRKSLSKIYDRPWVPSMSSHHRFTPHFILMDFMEDTRAGSGTLRILSLTWPIRVTIPMTDSRWTVISFLSKSWISSQKD